MKASLSTSTVKTQSTLEPSALFKKRVVVVSVFLCLCMCPKQFRPFQAAACLFLSAPFSRILDTLKVDGNGGGKGEERDMSNE